MGLFFRGEREATERPESSNHQHPQPADHLPQLHGLPPAISPNSTSFAEPSAASQGRGQSTASPEAQDHPHAQALDAIYNAIQQRGWTSELRRAFKAVGHVLDFNAYEAYPETFGQSAGAKRPHGGKGE